METIRDSWRDSLESVEEFDWIGLGGGMKLTDGLDRFDGLSDEKNLTLTGGSAPCKCGPP